MEVILQNRLTEIPKAHALLDELAARFGLSPKTVADLQVALEEHLTNIVNHGYIRNQVGRIVVRFQPAPTEIRVEIEDDARPFNPLVAPPADVHQPLEERPIGGLGIHMIRQLTDDLSYETRAGHNVLTLIKQLPERPPPFAA